MKHYTDNTLMELLKHPDKTVQRHAKGIENRLHAIELEQLEYIQYKCPGCMKRITMDEYNAYDTMCKPCFEFYNK